MLQLTNFHIYSARQSWSGIDLLACKTKRYTRSQRDQLNKVEYEMVSILDMHLTPKLSLHFNISVDKNDTL